MEATKLGRYDIQSELGRGAMGVVYKATDPLLERTVAIKTINMALERDGAGQYEARFYQEARAAGSLNHPNIVTVYDVGKAGDVAYMAMEFIEGRRAALAARRGPAAAGAQAVSIAAQVAEGLAYAHQHGVVHRDIKPANIMVVADGPVKITDFGIARMRAAGRRADADRHDARLAEVHVARAGDRQARRPPLGHLLARRDPLRDARRRARRSTART